MAYFIRGTGSALTPTEHSRNIFKNYLKQMSLSGLFGKKGSGKPIIVDDTLSAKAGDTIRYHFIPQDETAGIEGQNATILGNETAINEYYFDLTVDQLAKAYRKKGKMTDQRAIFSFREEAKMQLQNWWAQKSEDLLFAALTGGVTGNTVTYVSGADTTDWVAGAYRCIRASGANGSAAVTAANSDNTAVHSAMTNSDTLSYRLIVDAGIMARTEGTFKMRPIRVGPDGEEFFILFVHPKSARDLMFSADWQNHALAVADVFGKDMDPIARGALGVVDNVIVKRSERILTTTLSTEVIARNLLLGADAAILGWAQKLDYTEELIDHKREMSIAADEIRGQRKVVFSVSGTDTDAGVIQVLAAAA
jgi:N4-gp56 family major capsid protein